MPAYVDTAVADVLKRRSTKASSDIKTNLKKKTRTKLVAVSTGYSRGQTEYSI